MGLLSSIFGTHTKSYYADEIAREQVNLANLKAGLASLKANHGGEFNNSASIAAYKQRIEQKKDHIAQLKAMMKAAPKG